ncbi:MAG: DNRLRE domain-containing protein [Nitrolancea sp.]
MHWQRFSIRQHDRSLRSAIYSANQNCRTMVRVGSDTSQSRLRRVGLAIAVLMALATWMSFVQRASATSVDFLPVADASVYQDHPTTSYGARQTLEVDGSPIKQVYLRFDIPTLAGAVTRATLTLHVVDSSNHGGDVHTVSSSDWDDSVTWVSHPATDSQVVASIGSVRNGSNVSVDVTNTITGSGSISFALTSSSSDGADFSSRESSHPPVLTIEMSDGTTAPPPPFVSKVTPVADVSVTQSQPNTSLGSRQTLEVDNSPMKDIYVRFDVPHYDSSMITKATLTFSVVDSSDRGGDIYSLSDTTWSESITWNTRPAIDGARFASLGRVHENSTVSVDITSAIKSPGLFSLAIVTTSSDGADYDSRESSHPPVLTIETVPLPSLSLPVRAAFYYPWFPSAWNQQGFNPFTRYDPTLDYYDSGDQSVIDQHVAWMQQAGLQAAIASWWGIGTPTDINFHKILQSDNNGFKWAIYHEQEGIRDLTQDDIRADLAYLRDTAFADPDYLRIDGKPVVFVYNTDNTDAGVAERWVPVAKEFNVYLSLKVFAGYRTITPQPDSWHQYAPSSRLDRQSGFATTISPGFWRIDETDPRLARDETAYANAVQQMTAYNDPWQLITTFNEWGEGTAIEPSTTWGTRYLQLTAGVPVSSLPSP